MLNNKCGTLYVVATPIGNLQDITLRAIETLKNVDMIVAEDTRHSTPLLNYFSIKKPIISMHEWNERDRVKTVLTDLQAGKQVALISDAGTPLISDPGYRLVAAIKAAGLPVVPIPGACAAIAALSVAGLPTDQFIFEGFLPAKREACRNRLKRLRQESRTLIFYEAPHRLLSLLQSLEMVFGKERKAVVARELTKIHETISLGSLSELVMLYSALKERIKGEMVVLVAGQAEQERIVKEVVPIEVLTILLKELPLKQAVHLASLITDERKNILYELALGKQKS